MRITSTLALILGLGWSSGVLADTYVSLQVSKAKSDTVKPNCDYADAMAALIPGTLGVAGQSSCDDSDIGFRAALGLKATDNWNTEFGLQKIGSFEASVRANALGLYETFSDDILGLDISMVGNYPLNNSGVTFQPRLGLMFWNIDAAYETNTGGTISDSDTVSGMSPVVGLGIGIDKFLMSVELIKDVGSDDMNSGFNYQGDVTRFNMGLRF